jgi:hypothetical protein
VTDTLEAAATSDGIAVHMRLLRRDERELVAVIAEVDGRCVGIASYVALPEEPGAAEVAVTVTDRYQAAASGGCWWRPCGRWPSVPA